MLALLVIAGLFELGELLGELGHDAGEVVPLKAGPGGAVGDGLGAGESGGGGWDAVEDGCVASLCLFDGLPLLFHGARGGGEGAAENVGVTADELVLDLAEELLVGELALVRGDLAVEDDLDEEVAELLHGVGGAAPVQGVEGFIGLL